MTSSTLLFISVLGLSMLDLVASAAQTLPDIEGWSRVILNLGVAVYIILWFSTRMEKRLLALERVLYVAAKKDLLTLATNRLVPEDVRREASNLTAELERLDSSRKNKS